MTPEQLRELSGKLNVAHYDMKEISPLLVPILDALDAAADLIESQAQRIRELEGAAITDAAVERAIKAEDEAVFDLGLRWRVDIMRHVLKAALRSESHQASAEEKA